MMWAGDEARGSRVRVKSPAWQALTRAFARCGPGDWGKLRDQWVEGLQVERWIFEQVQVVD